MDPLSHTNSLSEERYGERGRRKRKNTTLRHIQIVLEKIIIAPPPPQTKNEAVTPTTTHPTSNPIHFAAFVAEEPLTSPVVELDPLPLGGGVAVGRGPLPGPPPWTRCGFAGSWREVGNTLPFSLNSPTQFAMDDSIPHERLYAMCPGNEA